MSNTNNTRKVISSFYFLDNDLQLQKIVTSKNVISAIHEQELNGLIRADIELDLSYSKFLVAGIDYVGYHYKDNFYLHKIQRVEHDHVDEITKVVLRHIFFEDMLYGKIIKDIRPVNREASYVLRNTIDTHSRWRTVMTDVTGSLSTNFYWQVMYEVIEFVTENYRIEYLPVLKFDGQKVTSFELHAANRIGEDKNIRIPFGSRVLELKYDVDYSEIVTRLVGHGKGEEVGDGYGRRIDFKDINFNKNGVVSPIGDVYMEDESITAMYGNDGQTPREGRIVFEDIEDPKELANETYNHYLKVSRPQMLFTADVADIGDVGIGDSVLIIRREHDLYFKARIHKLSVDLLNPSDAQVELGDYEHFKHSKIERVQAKKEKNRQQQTNNRIESLKRQFDTEFDAQVDEFRKEFEQKLIDVNAQIQADKEAFELRYKADKEALRSEIQDSYDNAVTDVNAKIEEDKETFELRYKADKEAISREIESSYDNAVTDVNKKIEADKEAFELRYKEDKEALSGEIQSSYTNAVTEANRIVEAKETDFKNYADGIGSAANGRIDDLYEGLGDLNSEFENLEIGGRNLILNSKNIGIASGDGSSGILSFNNSENLIRIEAIGNKTTTQNFYNTAFANSWVNKSEIFISIQQGIPYTLSMEVKYKGQSNVQLGFDTRGVNSVDYARTEKISDTGGKWVKLSATKVEEGRSVNTQSLLIGWFDNVKTGDYIEIRNLKLEKGNKATPWSPAPEDVDQKLTIIANDLDGVQTKVENNTGAITTVTQLATGTQQRVTDAEGNINTITNLANGTQQTVTNMLNGTATKGTVFQNTVDGFLNRAWQTDIDKLNFENRNLLLNSNNYIDNVSRAPELIIDGKTYRQIGYIWGYFFDVKLSKGTEYTISIPVYNDSDEDSIARIFGFFGNNTKVIKPKEKILFSVTGTANEDIEGKIYFLTNNGSNPLYFSYAKLELGNKATPWSPAPEDLMKYTDIVGRPDGFLIGTFEMGGDKIAQAIVGKSGAIDLIAQNVNFTGNVNVANQIKAYSLEAVYADISELRTKVLTANSVTSNALKVDTALINKLNTNSILTKYLIADTAMIENIKAKSLEAVYADISELRTKLLIANSVEANALKVDTALINKLNTNSILTKYLIADNAIIESIKSKSLESVYANISELRTKVLTTNSVTATALKVDTALINKLNTNNILTNYLIADNAMIENIKSKSLEAVYADISELRTRMLVANVINADMVKFDTALIEKFTSSTAFINSLTAKSAFIRDIKAIDIDFNRASATGLNGSNTLLITGDRIEQRGKFNRRYNGKLYNYDVTTTLRGGYLRFGDDTQQRAINISAFGISTYLDGDGEWAGSPGSSGYIQWWDGTYSPSNANGITMGSYNVVALKSDNNRVVLDAEASVSIESQSSPVYIYPYKRDRPGLNRFNFTTSSTGNATQVYGYIMYGAGDENYPYNAGLRFYKNESRVAVVGENFETGGDTTLEAGSVEVNNVKRRSDGRFAYWNGSSTGTIDDVSSKTSGQLLATSMVTIKGDRDMFLGTRGGGILRVTNEKGYNSGGGITYRDIHFQNWKANSHEDSKYEIQNWSENILDVYRNELKLKKFKLNSEKDLENQFIHRGIVIRNDSTKDEFPVEWRNGDGFNGNEVMWWNTKAIQELAYENDSLKNRINDLENKLNKIMEMIA